MISRLRRGELTTHPEDMAGSLALSVVLLAVLDLGAATLMSYNAFLAIQANQVPAALSVIPGDPWTWIVSLSVCAVLMFVGSVCGWNRVVTATLIINGFWSVTAAVALTLAWFEVNGQVGFSLLYPFMFVFVAVFHLKNAWLSWHGRCARVVTVADLEVPPEKEC